MQANLEDLIAVDEIGDRIAQSAVAFFEDEKNRKIIERLKSYGLQLKLSEEKQMNTTDKLKEKTIVVSGVFYQLSRDELKKAIENNGGKVSSSISKKTDFIVAGDNMGPSKKTKADELGVPIISEQDFINIIS